MNRNNLYESIGHIDDKILERSEKNKRKKRHKRSRFVIALAAILTIAIVAGLFLAPENSPIVMTTYAIREASYPNMAPYPVESSPTFLEDYHAWSESVTAQKQELGYADNLKNFFTSSIQQILSSETSSNRAYSPLNVYLALGMIAEITDNNSRQQILDLLEADSIDTLRTQATALWNAHYRNDGATTSILASSLWLDDHISFVPSTLDTLADTYYASSYQGTMESTEMIEAFQNWLSKQTGGLLDEQVENITLDKKTIMVLATSIYFQAKWESEFEKSQTTSDTFHSLSGDITCDFMHKSTDGTYYWGDQFSAVGKRLNNDGGTMWFILPDEGVSIDNLLYDEQTMDFIMTRSERNTDDWENQKRLIINLSLPKFDITSQMDLAKDLQALGITDVFNSKSSDFSPLTTDMKGISISKVPHDVRVAIDEEGVTATAYTAMLLMGAAPPPDDKVDFILDRPFLFAITSDDGLPLFVGVVQHP